MARFLLVCFLLLTGCATTRTVELKLPNTQDAIEIQAGDSIELTMKSGDEHRIKVASVNESVIKSEQEDFKIEEIAKIEKTELTPTGAAAAAGAGVAVGLILSAMTSALILAIIW